MQAPDYVPLSSDAIADQLKLKNRALRPLYDLLSDLSGEGIIVQIKRNRFCLPSDANLISGRILFRQSGSARLIPDDFQQPKKAEPLPIRAEDTGTAFHGDHVLCRFETPSHPRHKRRYRHNNGDAPFVSVIRILQKACDTLTGTLQRDKACYYVIPDEPRLIYDIIVPDPKHAQLKPVPRPNQKVVVRLSEWTQRHLNPQGEIIETLGETHTPDAELRALIHKYKLDPEFSDSVQREIGALPKKVTEKSMRGRLDLTKAFTLTIDPSDAKDFDDALSIEKQSGGDVRIGVHIADVSAYVRPGSALDKEAQKRGNSTYLVGQVIPMLPYELSNDLCSLVEGENRLVQSVLLTFTSKGRLKDAQFARAVIRSRKRLTYEQAYALLSEDALEKIRTLPLNPKHHTGSVGRSLSDMNPTELAELQGFVRQLWRFAARMRTQRMKKGSLDLDMPEVKIFVDPSGAAECIEKVEYDESHQLIEEFMLLANEVVAERLAKASLPCLYRVHDKPDGEKLTELSEYLQTAGVQTGDLTAKKHMMALLAQLKDHPQGYPLKIAVLRSLKQACYRADVDGHYGLGKRYYTHFTSPIRRYADLIVHRILEGYLKGQASKKKAQHPYRYAHLTSLGEHLSSMERNSTDAERESVKIKLLEFFSRELTKKKKTVFPAIITQIQNHGMFIELTDSMTFGLVHVSTLKDDLYYRSPDGSKMVGRRWGRAFSLGQEIQVVVARVDLFKREIDFNIALP